MPVREHYDFLVLGAGPSGQKAAVQAAKAGRSVALVDRDRCVGGECVKRGTIPSKTLRESAVYLQGLRTRSEGVLDLEVPDDLKVVKLMRRLRSVLDGQMRILDDQMKRNGIEQLLGRARFVDAHTIELREPRGGSFRVGADTIVVATGSRPRKPPEIEVDHEHVLDSDSILSLIYLPKSLAVLGGGVIACEFASMFSALGVEVTIVDRYARPLGFLDPELSEGFLASFEGHGGCFLGEKEIAAIEVEAGCVRTRLAGGEELVTDKLLCAQGRVANVKGLGLEEIGIELSKRGHVPVNEFCQTALEHVYAVGDVVGPPALAATAMEQGRRAARHALGLDIGSAGVHVPIGIYTVPEIASVGLTEDEVRQRDGDALVGRAAFCEVARGLISGNTDGLLKLVCDGEGRRILGAQIVGEGATDLIHVAQMAMIGEQGVDVFVRNVMNFPTMAEAYRVAALDVTGQRARRKRAA